MDEEQQRHALDPLPDQVRLNKSRGAERGAEDVDAVVAMPLAVDVRVRVVPQGASVRDAVPGLGGWTPEIGATRCEPRVGRRSYSSLSGW